MDGDIELDDIRVVTVTGKAYKDKPRESKRKFKCWNPSLRIRTLIIYVCIALAYVIGAIILVGEMRVSLENLDREALNKSIGRFVMFLRDDGERLQPYTKHAAWQRVTAEAVAEGVRNLGIDPPLQTHTAINKFIQRYLNTTTFYHKNGTIDHVYRCGSMVNFWGMYDSNFTELWYEYHPGDGSDSCSLFPITAQQGRPNAPMFPPDYLRGITGSNENKEEGFLSLFSPIFTKDPMAVSIEAIFIPDENGKISNNTPLGYLLAAKTIKKQVPNFAANVPGCISMVSSVNDEHLFDDEDWRMWNESDPGTFLSNKNYTGAASFTRRSNKYLKNCSVRYCPGIPLFNDTDEMMTGYFTLCGQDPKNETIVKSGRITCIEFRMDRPMSRMEEGTAPVIWLSVLVVALMSVLFILFIIFLDFAVLRRVVKLSNIIRHQTAEQRVALKDADDVDDKKKVKGKRAKNSDRSSKSSSDDSGLSTGDEIRNLKRAVEQNTVRLRKRVEAINDIAKVERQKILRHKQAMQLLSLWCDRKEFFPGLRPNALMLRYEPTRSLDNLLANPLSVEYLKSHCDSDCTLENLFFLLDVSWLSEIELAEDEEKDAAKRKQIHKVASETAKTMIERYIADNAPQQINISAGTFEVIRKRGTSYKRGMFNEAVSEVKLMLNTDILPRFQTSTAYSAMSENLYIDSIATDDDSDWSSESVSTAGSVLSDEANTGATSGMVAFNFRNLYASFDGDTDLGSTCTNEMSVIEDPDPVTTSTITGQIATGTNAGTVSSSTKDGSSVNEYRHRDSSSKKDDESEKDDVSEKDNVPEKDDVSEKDDASKKVDDKKDSSSSSEDSTSSDKVSSDSTSTSSSSPTSTSSSSS